MSSEYCCFSVDRRCDAITSFPSSSAILSTIIFRVISRGRYVSGTERLLNSTVKPYSIDSNYIHWNFVNLRPGELVTIEYSMRAARNGAYTNRVHVDASAMDGSGSSSADASAFIDVRETGVAPRTVKYGEWQPPDWDLNTSDEGISI